MKNKFRALLIVVLGAMLLSTLGLAAGCNKQANCTVTFVSDGEAVQSVTVKKDTAIGELPVVSKDGFEFSGWADTEGGEANVDENYVVTKDVTFYAVFKKVQQEEFCTVTYFTDGTAVADSKVKKGDAIGLLPFTDKRGYSFSGWFFDKDLTVRVCAEDVITQNVTLYAGFEIQNVDSVLPEYTELSIGSDDVNFQIKFRSKVSVDERNLSAVLSVTALYGKMPKMSVTSEGGDRYVLSPIGGYQNGGVYKIAITDENVEFVDIAAKYGNDYTEEKSIKTLFLSVETEDEEIVSVKSGVLEISRSSVVFSEDEDKFTVSKSVYESLPFEEKAVIRLLGETAEDDNYITVTGVEAVGEQYEISFSDCDDVDEVYEDFELNVGGVGVANEMTVPENQSETDKMLAETVSELYSGRGTMAITEMLAGALNASPTIGQMTASSENSYRDNVSDKSGKTFTMEGLLDDLEIKVTLGTANNTNFDGIGISPFDDTPWTMLGITFIYETDIKNNVKLEATITITQYLFVGLASSANKSTGDFKAEITPFSQTDIEFKVLVCSASKDGEDDEGEKKEEKKDISVEIENLANGEGDSSNIIEDVQEMLENKGDAVELCKVPLFAASYSVAGVISINFDLNFVIKVSFAAGIKIDATLLEATTIGVTGNYKTRTVDCYRRAAQGSDRYIFDFYAYGYLGVKAGIEGELTVSFLGLKKALRAGVSLEVGAYADLYGYLHYHAEEKRVFKDVDTNGRHFQTLEGGMYFESGIYVELGAFVGVGKKEYGISKDFKFKLLEAGDKYLYVEACENADLSIVFNENEDNSLSLNDLIPVEGKFMDITTGEVETRIIPSKNIRIISNTNLFRVDQKNNKLVADKDKIEQRLLYGIPYGTVSVYFKGQSILFASSYLNENIPELKGFKELCKVTVVYLPEGTELDEETEFGKEITITYVVKSALGEEVVKTETHVSGQYYKGGIPEEIVAYCRKNGLLAEVDGSAVTYSGFTGGRHLATEDATFVFTTVEAQRFIAIKYKSSRDFASDGDVWTVDVMAMNYNELPVISDEQKYTPLNVYYEYFVVTPDGNRKVMGNEYLSKYDLYMRGTYGYETGKVLATVNGTAQKIDDVFAQMKNGEGDLKDYSEFFTFTLEAEYITGMHTVYFYAPNGDCASENVKYGETFKVPDYWITNINQSASERLAGWDTDDDKKADILPNEQFTVTRDMVLRPVMTALGYTITVIDFEGNTEQFVVEAGSDIPEKILDVINSDPGAAASPSEGSFYSENYWRILTTDFVAGNDRTPYFKGVSSVYRGDITVMPACDVVITGVKGDLYHYVTLVDTTDGHFTCKNENGETVTAKNVKIAVKDGSTVGASDDYKAKELKYVPPQNVSYYSSTYRSSGGEVLDLFNTAITKADTYNHTTWVRYDGTYAVSFEYYLHGDYDIVDERKRNVVGITDEEKLNELLAQFDEEYDLLTSKDYNDSLCNAEFEYSVYDYMNMKNYRFVDGYGITHISYIVHIKRVTREYTVYNDYNSKNNENFTYTVKYGQMIVASTGVTAEVEVEDETGKYIYYYDVVGYDIDGDGIVDIKPGEWMAVVKDVTLKAIFSSEPRSINRL